MKEIFLQKYMTPILLAIIIFASNFINTDLFDFGSLNFSVWFALSFLSFVCGWYINKTLKWKNGGAIVFAIIIASTLISIVLITFFGEYFGTGSVISENVIIYSLRNVMLGAMALFGMSVAEVIFYQKEIDVLNDRIAQYEHYIKDAKKEAELTLKEAKIHSEKIINDAENKAKNILLKRERIEKELKEFIQIERELIKKYEENN